MSDDDSFTIGELAERAGVTPRTIRYYTAEGLLPRPDTRGQYARYGAEHLLRLRLIARLKAAYLPLHEIRARLEGLGIAELQALLAADRSEEPEPSTSAAEYLTQVLGRQAPSARLAESPAAYQPAPEPPESVPALRVPAPIAAPPAPPAPAAAVRLPEPHPPAGQAQAAPAPQVGRVSGLLGRLIPKQAEPRAAEPAPAGEAWRRIELAPGVELHVRESAAAGGRVARLISFARELFAHGDED